MNLPVQMSCQSSNTPDAGVLIKQVHEILGECTKSFLLLCEEQVNLILWGGGSADVTLINYVLQIARFHARTHVTWQFEAGSKASPDSDGVVIPQLAACFCVVFLLDRQRHDAATRCAVIFISFFQVALDGKTHQGPSMLLLAAKSRITTALALAPFHPVANPFKQTVGRVPPSRRWCLGL